MLIDYMRVFSDSDRQTTNLQSDALLADFFEDHTSVVNDQPGLTKALAFVQPGDVLVVWKLDQLGRSLSHLSAIVKTLIETLARIGWPNAEKMLQR